MGAQRRRKRVPQFVFIFVPAILVALVALSVATPRFPSRNKSWTRLDDHTIALKGEITSGNFFKFTRVFNGNVTTVILDSGGGLVYEAVQIGTILKDANVHTIVDGVCLSSCANYLFTAGGRKTIRSGVVGFHGNEQAFARQAGGIEAVMKSLGSQLSKLSSAEREASQAEFEQSLLWERTFFADLGIDQTLFQRTQRPDKGMNDGKTYAFLLPTPATFERYGIRNVEGVQNSEVKRRLEKELSLPLVMN